MMKAVISSVMKKFFAAMGLMMAAIVSLVSCQPKELGIENLPAGRTIYINASTEAATKTVNDGLSTLWEAKDTLNVFYQAASGYQNLGKASLASGENTKSATLSVDVPASVELPASDASVKWYAIFPYNSHIEAPDGKTGYNYIGHSKGLRQSTWDDMSSLRGNICPMYGVAEGKIGEVNIPMKHITSVIELNVTNSTGSEIVVTSISYTASEDIVGTYYFAIDDNGVDCISSGSDYVYSTATVKLEKGALAANASGKAYLAIKPYTQNGPVTIKVNCNVDGKDMTAEITKTPTGNQAVFSAGKIKKVDVDIAGLGEKSDKISDVHAAASGTAVVVKDVVVSSVMKQGFFVTDNTDILYVFLRTAPSVTAGQKVSVSGTTAQYQGNKQITNEPAPEITVDGEGKVTLEPVAYTGADVDAAFADNNAKYVTVEATATSTTLASVEGAECVLYISTNNRADGVTIAKDKKYTLTGYVYGHRTSSGSKQVYFYVESATEVGGTTQEATLSVSPTSVSIPQEGGSAEVTVTSDNSNWSVDNSTLGDWLNCSVSGNVITFSASANTDTKRSSTVTIKHSNGTLTKTVKVSQEGAIESDILTLSAASVSFNEEGGSKEVTVTCNASADWSIDSSTIPSWITATADKANQKIVLQAQANTGSAREGVIVVNHSSGEISRNLAVSQAGKSTGGTATYVKVNSIEDGGQYLIVSTYTDDENKTFNRAFNGALSTLDAASNFVDVVISGSSITTDKDCYFVYNASEGSFKSASGKYVAAKGTSDANGLTSPDTYSAGTCKMTVSFDGYDVNIVAPSKSVLRYNPTEGQDRFRFYKSSTYTSQEAIQLYKKQ